MFVFDQTLIYMVAHKQHAQGLVKIYSVHDKSPEFIGFQHLTFKKFLLDHYEFIVCDNADTPENSKNIHDTCKALGVKVLSIPERMHNNANIACSYPLDWLTQEVIAKETEADYSVFIDSDMFLIKPLSFINYLAHNEIGAVFQSRGIFGLNNPHNHIVYFWNALVLFNHTKIQHIQEIIWACSVCNASPYFPQKYYSKNGKLYSCDLAWSRFFKSMSYRISIRVLSKILTFVELLLSKFLPNIKGEGVDVGGPTYFYIKKYTPRIKWISCERVRVENNNLELIPMDLQKMYQSFYTDLYGSDFLCDKTIFHYRAGSNWNGMSPYLQAKKKYFAKKLLEHYLEYSMDNICNKK